eukprot:TRINITY_DN308_c0_g1_i1.p2 TRINITY_DN308_c0_g1~~TRINITY_DN308_c0_g1_i1.p2  ORF type:complete len:123 (-),score=61.42 TRINITY_DN308_c0_g1_i1:133-501(-)
MSSSGSLSSQTSIQKLLAAEKKAQEIISEAKRQRIAKLKQAKEEADKEILRFKEQREAEFQRNKEQILGTSGAFTRDLEYKANQAAAQVRSCAAANRADVISLLLKTVQNVDYDIVYKKEMK